MENRNATVAITTTKDSNRVTSKAANRRLDRLDKYYALPDSDQEAFLRACYWLNLGRFYWNYSFSTSFFAFVAAIESLVEEEKQQPHPCGACGEDHHPGTTRAFRRFLTMYAPDSLDRQRFYELRSRIAHGSRLLTFDESDEFGGFEPISIQERSEHDALDIVVKAALTNWLDASTDRRE